MKHSLILLIGLFTFNFCFAQSKQRVKAEKLFQQAIDNVQANDFDAAAKLLKQSIKLDSTFLDPYLALGGIFFEKKNYPQAVKYYQYAIEKNYNYTLFYQLPYAVCLAGNGDFEKAQQSLNAVLLDSAKLMPSELAAIKRRKPNIDFAVNYQNQHKEKYFLNPINMGDSINSIFSEYLPCLTIDGSQLIFTRKIERDNEDFFQSKKVNGTWQMANPLAGNLNTTLNEGAENISSDGKWLVFTSCNRKDGYGSCDLYISFLTENGWSKAENMGDAINSESWDSQPSLSPDKRELYFSSNRPGGYGGADLYVAKLKDNGYWEKPQNLGPTINTTGNEITPFIHADNQTLYFTSDGLPGYGEADIFFAKKNADNTWGVPINLGYPINTIDHEGSLFIANDGVNAFYAANQSDSRGGLDIYTFILPPHLRPQKTLWVQGRVLDEKTEKGLWAKIELTNNKTTQQMGLVQSDKSGNYLCTLPIGNEYVFTVNKKGYLFYSKKINLDENTVDSNFIWDIYLKPIEPNAKLVLNNILFETNQYVLKNNAQVELNNLVLLMKENDKLQILITGFTDNVGKDEDNLLLSKNRAKAVMDYLIQNGIDASRMKFQGLGETQPIATNDTDAGRELNRRTEIMVLKND